MKSPSDLSTETNFQSPSYSKILELLKNRLRNIDEHNDDDDDDDDDEAKRNMNKFLGRLADAMEESDEVERRSYKVPVRRGYFQGRNQPHYGKKPHWDTFFG